MKRAPYQSVQSFYEDKTVGFVRETKIVFDTLIANYIQEIYIAGEATKHDQFIAGLTKEVRRLEQRIKNK